MMKRVVVFALVCWAASALSLAEKDDPSVTDTPAGEFDQSTTTPTTKPTTTPTTTSTTTPTTTPTTKPTPKPTTKPTPKPTPKPTTKPTPKPTTKPTPKPTTKPTTTPTTTKPTTPAPPAPTPSTNLTVGNYTIMENKTVICLMAQMAVQIRLDAPKTNGPFIVQEKMTKTEGFCKGTKANLTLVFKEGFITFMFNKSSTDVYVDALSFNINYPLGQKVKYSASNASLHLFPAKIGHSYSCKADSIYMGDGLYLDVSQDRMQAFNLTQSNEFGSADPCPADRPDYRVAIAVGVTLLVLIIVVVVAYLLGRRRRADGYQSL